MILTIVVGSIATACASDGSGDASSGSESSGAEADTAATQSTSATSALDGSTSSGDDVGPSDGSGAVDGSSGSSSAGSTSDGGSSGGGARSCADYLFCEDFEAGDPGETPPGWTEHAGWDRGGSRAVLSAEESHGGSQSLKGAVGTNGQFRVAHDLAMLGGAVSHHWGRIFYK